MANEVHQRCISADSPDDWCNALQDIPHAFAHTWESCRAMQLTTGLTTYLYCFERAGIRIVCPIAERVFDQSTDIVTPYGFSGFVGNGDCPDFPYYWKEFVAQKGYLCGYIGLNPLFENSTYVDQQEVCRYNTLYVLDLTLSIDALFQMLSTNRKRQLKNWCTISKGLVIGGSALTDFFLTNYLEFVRAKKALGVYGFSAKTLSQLLSSKNVFVVGVLGSNGVEAVSVFGYTPYAAEYLFNVSLPSGRQHSAALIWYAINHLKERNIPRLNLGGGVRENDGVARFKQRFGAKELPLGCVKQVYDSENFAKLCHRAGTDPQDRIGYFPPYRKPQGVSSRVH